MSPNVAEINSVLAAGDGDGGCCEYLATAAECLQRTSNEEDEEGDSNTSDNNDDNSNRRKSGRNTALYEVVTAALLSRRRPSVGSRALGVAMETALALLSSVSASLSSSATSSASSSPSPSLPYSPFPGTLSLPPLFSYSRFFSYSILSLLSFTGWMKCGRIICFLGGSPNFGPGRLPSSPTPSPLSATNNTKNAKLLGADITVSSLRLLFFFFFFFGLIEGLNGICDRFCIIFIF